MISPWDGGVLLADAATRPARDKCAASKSCVDEETFAKGPMTLCHDGFRSSAGISPWRATICHSPTLAWNAPKAFPRRTWFEIPVIVLVAATNREIDSSVRPGNSEKIRYQVPS